MILPSRHTKSRTSIPLSLSLSSPFSLLFLVWVIIKISLLFFLLLTPLNTVLLGWVWHSRLGPTSPSVIEAHTLALSLDVPSRWMKFGKLPSPEPSPASNLPEVSSRASLFPTVSSMLTSSSFPFFHTLASFTSFPLLCGR